MPISATNCYRCKQTWTGRGALCPDCEYTLKYGHPPSTPIAPTCNYCGGPHETVDCYMATRYRRIIAGRTGGMNYAQRGPLLKVCPKCKGNYLIESKAGSVCSNCHTVTHNPCRNCNSQNTKGLKSPTAQYVECQDCLFIE